MNCPWCGAPEKEPREGARIWFTCGTHSPLYPDAIGIADSRSWRSNECCLQEDVNELNAEIEKLKAEIERLKKQKAE